MGATFAQGGSDDGDDTSVSFECHVTEVAQVGKERRQATRVKAADADRYVLGLTCVNDVTARDLQNKGAGYTRAKGFDTFAPLGPCITQGLDYARAEGLRVEGIVNGMVRQNSSTKELIFTIPTVVEFISHIMTLLPGDVIATGTPSGIGPLNAGDVVTIRVEGVGELTNPVSST